MIDFLSFIFDFFAVCFLVVILLIGLKLLHEILKVKIPNPNDSSDEQEDNQNEQDSKEDSNGDGLVLFDDPLFPEEHR